MRKIRNGTVNRNVLNVIERNYEVLKDECKAISRGMFSGEDMEDIFHDTIQFVCQDRKAALLETDSEVFRYFKFKYRMIKFQRIKDSKSLKETEYADYKQTSKKEDKEG